jgi:hypothetical protein
MDLPPLPFTKGQWLRLATLAEDTIVKDLSFFIDKRLCRLKTDDWSSLFPLVTYENTKSRPLIFWVCKSELYRNFSNLC